MADPDDPDETDDVTGTLGYVQALADLSDKTYLEWKSELQKDVLVDEEGAWTLELPFSSARELVMDILRYGPEVEVLSPDFLRDAVSASARRAAEIYD